MEPGKLFGVDRGEGPTRRAKEAAVNEANRQMIVDAIRRRRDGQIAQAFIAAMGQPRDASAIKGSASKLDGMTHYRPARRNFVSEAFYARG